ncbi:MAG: pilus assembly protein [Gammaproteobacteria bacterium]|nr:pilus assembly protein [Gammaproteobacteria bacterium]MDH5273093.1 pilus assembly protein [Gammaproteobacteria bacterium]
MTPRPASRRTVRGPRWSRGIAAVEFVVTAPFVLFLLFASVEFGRAFVQYTTLALSVRNSARFVSEHSTIGTTGVVSLSGTVITQARNLAVYGNIAGSGNARLPNYQTSQVTVIDAGNDNVRVAATYPYQPMLGSTLSSFGNGGGSIPLTFNMHIAVTMRAIS